jgi:hypothetical protein
MSSNQPNSIATRADYESALALAAELEHRPALAPEEETCFL